MENIEAGSKVKFLNPLTGKWKKGVVHGVRSAEDSNGVEHVITYMVDTGNDDRVDVMVRDLRGEELGRRLDQKFHKHPERRLDPKKMQAALEELNSADDLPEAKLTEEKIRHPELVDVRPDEIKLL